ncbi:hypothetical protein N782_12995 [Pontibacillus yanchengensis Y32]|uniref:Uncharacterized protein n=1 Tax=Pontibacillus yanchengensis Y32 TaxID=1385514 RepID=A0A0A2TA18_9BACI|nr:hypothetical protein N782_12995 [Pontibacillus yanchengensis Y32]
MWKDYQNQVLKYERERFISKLVSSLTIFVFLLSACSENERAIEIEDKGLANFFIQKVEGNSSSQ